MLRIDLGAAGIPYAIEGPDGPLYADFHALRHTYLTLGGRAGIDLRTLQELAGHSTPTLTARYSHRRLHDLAGAVEKLPAFLPGKGPNEALAATGTDGESLRSACAPTENPCVRLITADKPLLREGSEGDCRNPLEMKSLEGDCGPLRAVEKKAGDGIRTHDVQLGKLAFYR